MRGGPAGVTAGAERASFGDAAHDVQWHAGCCSGSSMVSRHVWIAALWAFGCGSPGQHIGDEIDGGDFVDAMPAPVLPSRTVVTEPPHGTVLTGDPLGQTLHVAGLYTDARSTLTVQVLADPTDLTTWTPIGTTTASEPSGDRFSFAVDVTPVSAGSERGRWPTGGILRLRVVDDTGAALPHDASVPDETVLAVVDATGAPSAWTYLTEKAPGSQDETTAYYAAIGAPRSLAAFQAKYGFGADDLGAKYYNAGDLGIGRDMHCRPTAAPAGGVACYVNNHGTFGGMPGDALARLAAGGAPLATVAMVYAPPLDQPNAVQFMVFAGTGKLTSHAQLDTHGDNKTVPQNCLNCHGGRSRYDATAHAAVGARFLPFDPAAFVFPSADPALTLGAQSAQLHALDTLVGTTSPTLAMSDEITGMWGPGDIFDAVYVPLGWSATPSDQRVYREVVAPYCRSCHSTFDRGGPSDPATFATAASFRAASSTIVARVCGGGPHGMPTAEATANAMFSSSARALLLTWLAAPGACAP